MNGCQITRWTIDEDGYLTIFYTGPAGLHGSACRVALGNSTSGVQPSETYARPDKPPAKWEWRFMSAADRFTITVQPADAALLDQLVLDHSWLRLLAPLMYGITAPAADQ